MIIRNATKRDKKSILSFCKNTFSWGDYIAEVWDYWTSEGSLVVVESDDSPKAVCHASFNRDGKQVWIEGVRVHPDYRRKGLASRLIQNVEKIAREKKFTNSFMLVEVNNTGSIKLAKKHGYKVNDKWWFYSLLPKKSSSDVRVKSNTRFLLSITEGLMYVKSWRWIPLTEKTLSKMIHENKIISYQNKANYSVAILTESEHFDRTLIITLVSNSKSAAIDLLPLIQNYAYENEYSRIQILTKLDSIMHSKIQKRFAFYLFKKFL